MSSKGFLVTPKPEVTKQYAPQAEECQGSNQTITDGLRNRAAGNMES